MVGPRSCVAALAAAFLMSVGSPDGASAQITGTVIGSVKDSQGALLPSATVTLVSEARGTTMDTQTNDQGDFVFPNVTAGTYLIRVALEGFKTSERPGLVVSPGDRVAVPTMTIELGAVNETITVRATAPVLQVNGEFYENLDVPKVEALIDELRKRG